jgi:hypothetical protein
VVSPGCSQRCSGIGAVHGIVQFRTHGGNEALHELFAHYGEARAAFEARRGVGWKGSCFRDHRSLRFELCGMPRYSTKRHRVSSVCAHGTNGEQVQHAELGCFVSDRSGVGGSDELRAINVVPLSASKFAWLQRSAADDLGGGQQKDTSTFVSSSCAIWKKKIRSFSSGSRRTTTAVTCSRKTFTARHSRNMQRRLSARISTCSESRARTSRGEFVGGYDPEAPPTGSISGTPGSCARQIPTSEGYLCYEENK